MIHQRKMRMEVTENLGVERGVIKKVVAFCGLLLGVMLKVEV